MIVHVVYRPALTVDLKVFKNLQQAKQYVKHLANLSEPSSISSKLVPDDMTSGWVIVDEKGPTIYPTLSDAPHSEFKPSMFVISSPVYAS